VTQPPPTGEPYPFAPPPPETYGGIAQPVQPAERPVELRAVIGFLLANLTLSCLLTVFVVLTRHSLVNYQLDHRHISDPTVRDSLRTAYQDAIWARVFGNLVASIVYTFLVRALLHGKRWAYRRVLFLSIGGIIGLLTLFATPYPAWIRVEQILQIAVLAGLLYLVTRPSVREWCVIPGRGRRGR
jgi:hypothetical protein